MPSRTQVRAALEVIRIISTQRTKVSHRMGRASGGFLERLFEPLLHLSKELGSNGLFRVSLPWPRLIHRGATGMQGTRAPVSAPCRVAWHAQLNRLQRWRRRVPQTGPTAMATRTQVNHGCRAHPIGGQTSGLMTAASAVVAALGRCLQVVDPPPPTPATGISQAGGHAVHGRSSASRPGR